MEATLFKVNSFAVYSFSLLVVLSFLWGSFIFYKKAIESHFEEIAILDIIVFVAFWSFVSGRMLYVLMNLAIFKDHWTRLFFLKDYPGISQWGLVVGILLGLFLAVRKLKVKYVDLLDMCVLGLLGGLPIYFSGLCFIQFKWFYLAVAIVMAFIFLFFWKAENDYRTYGWYRNKKTHAKSGFIAGSGIVVFGLLNLISQVWLGRQLIEMVLGGFLIVGGSVLVYIRSGRTVKEDIKIISNYGRKK